MNNDNTPVGLIVGASTVILIVGLIYASLEKRDRDAVDSDAASAKRRAELRAKPIQTEGIRPFTPEEIKAMGPLETAQKTLELGEFNCPHCGKVIKVEAK